VTDDSDDVTVHRYPILISEHCVALIQLFIKPHDRLDDIWTYDYIGGDAKYRQEFAAEELIRQLEDQYSPAFLMALRRACTKKLKEDDERYGTKFAEVE
jgi:hypothetical protein